MKCLVTGVAGFIGQNLVKRLCAEGATVTAVDNFSLGKELTLQPYTVEVHKLNVQDVHLYLKDDYDVIFHFGAPSSVVQYNKKPVECTLNTLLGFRSVLTLAEQCGAKLVYPSTGNVYGTVPPPQGEWCNPHPNNMYAACKLVTEHMSRHSEVESVGLRIFAGYGPGEEHKGAIASVVTLFLNDIEKKKPVTIYGDGEQSRDFIYIDDIIDGILVAAKKEVPQIVNLGTGVSFTFNELVSFLGDACRINPDIKHVDKPESYVEHTRADTYNMKKTLNISPRGLKEGIHDYLKARGKL